MEENSHTAISGTLKITWIIVRCTLPNLSSLAICSFTLHAKVFLKVRMKSPNQADEVWWGLTQAKQSTQLNGPGASQFGVILYPPLGQLVHTITPVCQKKDLQASAEGNKGRKKVYAMQNWREIKEKNGNDNRQFKLHLK